MNYIISRHAQQEMERRNIPLALVESVLNAPQQIVSEKEGRRAYQSRVDFGSGKVLLLRVIVADKINPAVIITVYKTSKFGKYWRQE